MIAAIPNIIGWLAISFAKVSLKEIHFVTDTLPLATYTIYNQFLLFM